MYIRRARFKLKGGVVMLKKSELNKSNKECAEMLGLSLNDYKKFCKTAKTIPSNESTKSCEKNSDFLLKKLGISEDKLKLRKDL